MPSLNKILTFGVLLLSSTALASPIAIATQATTAATPDTSTLQDPAASLDQQSQLQGSADVSLTPTQTTTTAATTETTAQPAQPAKVAPPAAQPTDVLAAQPATTATQPDVNTELPTLSSVLEQTGLRQAEPTTTTATATTTDAQTAPPQAPPGLDLPLDSNLPEAAVQQTEEEKMLEMRQQAFGAASQGMMPMRTEEIRKLLEMYDETQQAVQTPIYPNPTPESTFQTISLDPGTKPVELKTALGHVTTLSIVDATGQPWPIQDISWAGNFEVLQPESGSNMLRITPMADFAFGNVSMRLVGLNPPVILTLRTERKSVQVRADIQIPELGPNGVAPPIQRQITTTAGDSKLSTILEGVPPASANKLKVDGIDGRTSAYEVDGTTYVRTPYTLLSPAWDSSVRSADGTNVYAMKFTPVLLLSDKGKMVRAQLAKVVSDE